MQTRMKNISIILLGILLTSLGVLGQTVDDSVFAKHVIKTYPLNYFVGGEINLGYEQVVNRKESFEIILAWNFKDWVVIPSGSKLSNGGSHGGVFSPVSLLEEGGQPTIIPSTGGSVRFNYRHYFNKNKPMPLGAYYSPQFMFKHTNFNDLFIDDEYYDDSIKITKNAVTLKFLLGYQNLIFNKLSIDYYIGAGFRYQTQKAIRFYRIRWDEDIGEFTENTDRITYTSSIFIPTFHLGFSVGYFF